MTVGRTSVVPIKKDSLKLLRGTVELKNSREDHTGKYLELLNHSDES